MARKSSATKSAYISKGQRPNVSRKILNSMRRERRENPSVKSMFQKSDHRRLILSRSKDKSIAELHRKYVEEDRVIASANNIFLKYKSAGIKWAACIQAAKTDYLGQLEMKYGSIKVKTGGSIKADK